MSSQSIKSIQLRQAFARFATGIVVITAGREDGNVLAVTVNSFTSLSLEPPLVLWCLNRDSNCRPGLERAGHFTANVLRHDQQWISTRFARPSTCCWDDVPVRYTNRGAVIEGALAVFECSGYARHDGGDHVIFIGQVESFSVGPAACPLTYFDACYGSLTADQSGLPIDSALNIDGRELSLGWG